MNNHLIEHINYRENHNPVGRCDEHCEVLRVVHKVVDVKDVEPLLGWGWGWRERGGCLGEMLRIERRSHKTAVQRRHRVT